MIYKLLTYEHNDNFIRWLINLYKTLIIIYINTDKLMAFNNYIDENEIYKKRYINSDEFNVKNAIIGVLNNITYREIKDGYLISLHTNKPFPTHIASMTDICKLLNDGNLNFKGYPIFTTMFKHISDNLQQYKNQYYMQYYYGGM